MLSSITCRYLSAYGTVFNNFEKLIRMPGFNLTDFRYGSGVEVQLTAADTDKSNLILMKDDNNYMILLSARWDKKILVINTKTDGEFGEKQTIDNFDHASGTKVKLRIEGHQRYFAVFVNDSLVSKFPHRLPFEDIVKTKFYGDEDKLIRYGVLFRPIG